MAFIFLSNKYHICKIIYYCNVCNLRLQRTVVPHQTGVIYLWNYPCQFIGISSGSQSAYLFVFVIYKITSTFIIVFSKTESSGVGSSIIRVTSIVSSSCFAIILRFLRYASPVFGLIVDVSQARASV